ncbi:hypothetical protein FQA39_LY19106 [Lamprigera yunnana]|nr:hypothetical protein FQA39_LY19106 [Lamprigera yunnana]
MQRSKKANDAFFDKLIELVENTSKRKAAEKALGIEKSKSKHIGQKTHMKWLYREMQELRQEYVYLRNQVKYQVKIRKEEYWRRLCIDRDNTIAYNKSTTAWKVIKKKRNNRNSKQTLINAITQQQWIKQYSNLLIEQRVKYQQNETTNNDRSITEMKEEYVQEASKQAKNNKSTGLGNIQMETINHNIHNKDY